MLLTAIANITEDVTFEWTDPFGDIMPDTGAEISARTSGNYSVTVAGVNNNCSATDDIDVLIVPITQDQLLLGNREIRDIIEIVDDCDPIIHAPNAFTPDSSSGLNDTFTVFPNPYVTDFQIFIFSRQGEMVFQSTDMNFQWDGTFRGGLLQMGTYAYIMRYKSTLDLERGVIEQHGGVLLMR